MPSRRNSAIFPAEAMKFRENNQSLNDFTNCKTQLLFKQVKHPTFQNQKPTNQNPTNIK